MAKILGLDLGTNSIGWAIRDTHEPGNQLIDKGVLTFDKGVAEGKSGEFPMVQKRTESRGKRRNYQAEKYRKWALLETLIEQGMCPLTDDELNTWRKYKKGSRRKYPQSPAFIQWLRFDFDSDGKPDFEPFGFDKHESLYLFRMLAASGEHRDRKIFSDNPHILGRVLYQLVQRRGFRGRDEGESKTIMQGGGDSGSKGVNEIKPYISEFGTLGSALYHLQKEKGGRIRKRYNLRSDYEQELQTICRIHRVDDSVYKQLWKAIIWQRPLRSQKGMIGVCTFEKGKARCAVSHPFYEEYRTWAFINNLNIELPENVNREVFLCDKIYPLFYRESDFKLGTILKELKKVGGYIGSKHKFSDENDKKRHDKQEAETKVVPCKLLNMLNELLGEDWKKRYGWMEALENRTKPGAYSLEDIWHVLFTFDSQEKLQEFALEKLGLPPKEAERFSKIRLAEGYATLSLAAIKKMLPYLHRGYKYSHAVYLANINKVLGTPNLDKGLAETLANEIDGLIRQHKSNLKLDSVVNGLISDHQQAKQRWGMQADYQMDDDDWKDIEKKFMDVFGSRTWSGMTEEERKALREEAAQLYRRFLKSPINTSKSTLFTKPPRLHDAIFKYFHDTYGVSDDRKDLLWHPSEQEGYAKAPEVNGIRVLGNPQPISRGFKNPMALKTLYKLRTLVNHLLQTGKIDEDTRVVVEIARELNDANRRKALERWQRDREKQNAEYEKRIRELVEECGLPIGTVNKDMIDKYRLWIEQKECCIYTGKTIGLCDLFEGTRFDFEHTVPASISFDNELKNLSLADSVYNRQVKGNKLPSALPNYDQDVVIDGVEYTRILPRLEDMKEKVAALEQQYDEWKKKGSDDKEMRDSIIQKRHLIRMDLDYWRRKLDTFTIKEYKAGWRNSQLRDTQLITKYSLPYLKTVFSRVDVQKGSVTASFSEIFEVRPRLEKKSRDKHSHHAQDAAVLTLIPHPAQRDKILLEYNKLKDLNPHATYHEPPPGWPDFEAHYVLSIENEVLINYLPQHRTLTQTEKLVRKRGRIQYVKRKSEDGKSRFVLDDAGQKIPLRAKGDTIRGQLHKESFFGAIEMNGEMALVERYPVAAFTSITDCKNIVDDAVRKIVETTLQQRMDEGMPFDKAKLDPIPFPSGKALIKKVRCRVAAGRGYLTPEKALTIREHDFPSRHGYKQQVYAQNDENTVCLLYEGVVGGKIERAFRIIGLFELAQLGLRRFEDLKNESSFRTMTIGKKITAEIPLSAILHPGTKAIFFKENADELTALPAKELLSRIFRIYKFNEVGSPYLYLQNHLEARPNDQLSGGDTEFAPGKYQERLKLKADKFSALIEHRDFTIAPDGVISFNN